MIREVKIQVIAAVFAAVCVMLYFFFPVDKNGFQVFSAVGVFLVLLPVLFTRVVLRRGPESYGNGAFTLSVRDGVIVALAALAGIAAEWVLVKMGWGVAAYKATMAPAVFHNFKGFVVFEAVFALPILWVFTFFAWGFVYHGTARTRATAFALASASFFVLLLNHFHTPVLLVPLFFPVVAYWWMRERLHTMYAAFAVFAVNLALDTILIVVT